MAWTEIVAFVTGRLKDGYNEELRKVKKRERELGRDASFDGRPGSADPGPSSPYSPLPSGFEALAASVPYPLLRYLSQPDVPPDDDEPPPVRPSPGVELRWEVWDWVQMKGEVRTCKPVPRPASLYQPAKAQEPASSHRYPYLSCFPLEESWLQVAEPAVLAGRPGEQPPGDSQAGLHGLLSRLLRRRQVPPRRPLRRLGPDEQEPAGLPHHQRGQLRRPAPARPAPLPHALRTGA